MQSYLISSELSISQKKMLFILHTKMLKIKSNFSAFHGDILTCSLCEDPDSEETELHLLSCDFILQDRILREELFQVEFNDVFGNIAEQKKAAEGFSKIMNIYNKNKRKDDKPGVS